LDAVTVEWQNASNALLTTIRSDPDADHSADIAAMFDAAHALRPKDGEVAGQHWKAKSAAMLQEIKKLNAALGELGYDNNGGAKWTKKKAAKSDGGARLGLDGEMPIL
jgi:hypothetical protein